MMVKEERCPPGEFKNAAPFAGDSRPAQADDSHDGVDPLRVMANAVAALQENLWLLLQIKLDKLRVGIRNRFLLFVGALMGLLATTGLTVTAIIFVLHGSALGLSVLFGGRLWVGYLLAGTLWLLGLGAVVSFLLHRMQEKGLRRLKKKYPQPAEDGLAGAHADAGNNV